MAVTTDSTSENGYREVSGTRVRYVEPNYTNSVNMIGQYGKHAYELENPLEDYCIFIQLTTEIRGRTIRADVNSENTTITIQSVTEQGQTKVSFMKGTTIPGSKIVNNGNQDVNILTTNYTNSSLLDIATRDSESNKIVDATGNTEMFGIKSVDISYNSYFVPEVTVVFTDVRGAGLFAAEEIAHGGTNSGIGGYNKTDVTGSFFKSFFTMPYPKYTLTVKGYYGEAVSYELSVADWRGSFNSDTGNFEVTAKFLGYAYSFLGDVMVTALLAAPYSDYVGADYWDSQLDDRFQVLDANGNPTKMEKLGDICRKIKSAMELATAATQTSTEQAELTIATENSESINTVSTAYQSFWGKAKEGYSKHKVSDNWIIEEGNDKGIVLLVKQNSKNKTFKDFVNDADFIKGMEEAYEELKKAYEDAKSKGSSQDLDSNLNSLKFWEQKPIAIYEAATSTGTKNATAKGGASKNGNSGGNAGSSLQVVKSYKDKFSNGNHSALLQNVETYGKKLNTSVCKQYGTYSDSDKKIYGYHFVDYGFYDATIESQAQADVSVQGSETAVNAVYQRAVSDSLGFVPTVRNFTKVFMAHFETLVKMIKTCTDDILAQNRTLESCGVETKNVPDVADTTTLPPFPKITERIESGDVKTDEEAWVGSFTGDFLEEDLINGILNGVSEIAKVLTASSGESGSTASETLNTTMEVPLTPYDMVLAKKPYGDVNMSEKNLDSFAGNVTMRLMALMGLPCNDFANIDADTLAAAEATNFYKQFGAPSSTFTTAISADGFKNDFIKMVTNADTKLLGSNKTWAWEPKNSKNTKHIPLITEVNGTYQFNIGRYGEKGNKGTIIPIQGTDFSKFYNDVKYGDDGDNSKMPSSLDNYVTTFNVSENSSSTVKDVNSIYISDNVDRFKTLAEKVKLGTEKKYSIDALKTKFTDNATYKGSAFERLFRKTDYIKALYDKIPSGSSKNGFVIEGKIDDLKKDSYKIGDVESKRGESSFFKDDNHDTSKVTLIQIPGFKDNEKIDKNDIDDGICLFSCKQYYECTTDYEKAITFLTALNYYVDYESAIRDSQIFSENIDKTFSILPKACILLIGGSYYWYKSNKSSDTKSANRMKNGLSVPVFPNQMSVSEGVQNVFIDYFTKWVSSEFTKIDNSMSFKFKTSFKDFTEKLSDNSNKDKFQTYVEKHIEGYTMYTSYSMSEVSGKKLKLGLRENTEGVKGIVQTVLTPVITAKLFKNIINKGNNTTYENIAVSKSKFDSVVDKFISNLKELYKGSSGSTNSGSNSTGARVAKDCDTQEDIKIAVYRYCKLLYDKWLSVLNVEDFSLEKMFGDDLLHESTGSDDRFFYFIDSFYNRIGDRLLLNLGPISEAIMNGFTDKEYTLLSFLSYIYSQNKLSFYNIQNFVDISDPANMKKMFKPVSYLDMAPPDPTPNFIVMYPYEASSHLDLGEDSPYLNDGFDISVGDATAVNGVVTNAATNHTTTAKSQSSTTAVEKENYSNQSHWPVALTTDESAGWKIPAFGVSYGKMYQSYFTKIDVGMENPMVTEQSLKAQFQIACMNNDGMEAGKRGITTLGQDLFTVYSNNSYTAKVDMMGCAWVQPLMYFVLQNIPMFRGTYLIEKVSHHIEPGKMNTTFTGVRMANTTTRLTREWLVQSTYNPNGADIEAMKHALAGLENDCPYGVYYPSNGGAGTATSAKGYIGNFYRLKYAIGGSEKVVAERCKTIINALTQAGWSNDVAVAMASYAVKESMANPNNACNNCSQGAFSITFKHGKCDGISSQQGQQCGLQRGQICSLSLGEQAVKFMCAYGITPVGLAKKVFSKEVTNADPFAIVYAMNWWSAAWTLGEPTEKHEFQGKMVTYDEFVSNFYPNNLGTANQNTLMAEIIAWIQNGYQYPKTPPKKSGSPGIADYGPDSNKKFDLSRWFGTTVKSVSSKMSKMFSASAAKKTDTKSQANSGATNSTSNKEKDEKKEGSKLKELRDNIIAAINTTSNESTVKVNVGHVDVSDDVTRLTATTNANLSGVFDICLNGYYQYIQNIYWVVKSTNNLKDDDPAYVEIKVAENPSSHTVQLCVRENDNSSATVPNVDGSGISDKFIKSIIKKYGSCDSAQSEVKNPNLNKSSLCSSYHPTSCESLLPKNISSMGTACGANMPALDQAITDAVCDKDGHEDGRSCYTLAGASADRFASSTKNYKTSGLCARHSHYLINVGLGGGPQSILSAGQYGNADMYYEGLKNDSRFQLVTEGPVNNNGNDMPGYTPQPGDICVVKPLSRMHICVFGTRGRWCSDFVQRAMGVHHAKETCRIFRYIGG